MRDFEDSTLWRISAFERVRLNTGTSGYARLEGPSVLSTTLVADLHRLEHSGESDDVLEVMASCLRHREPALLYLQYEEVVWPVTLFPHHMLYHSPRDLALAAPQGLATMKLLHAEPPGVRPPGHWMHERVANTEHYRPLQPLLWQVALYGARGALLSEISGTAAYRALKNPTDEGLSVPGAMGSAVARLRRESVSLRTMSTWPGLSVDRASRLLNALYMASALMMTRTHPAARAEPGLVRSMFGLGKPRR